MKLYNVEEKGFRNSSEYRRPFKTPCQYLEEYFFFFGSTTSNRDGGITAADLKEGVFMD